MGILYESNLGRSSLLRSSNVEDDPVPMASRRYCRVCTPISGDCISICQICQLLGEVEMCFFSETFVSSRSHISELMFLSFGRPMQLLRSEVDRFRGLVVNVRDGFSAYRYHSYECGCCEAIVVRICSGSHNVCVRRVLESRFIRLHF